MSSGRAREKHFKEKQYERKTTGQRKREKHSGRAQSGSELDNDGTRPVIRSEMSDERILYGDFHAVGRAIEAVFRQRAMFSDFGEILRSLAFRIKAIGYSAQRQIPTRVHFKISDVFVQTP